MARLTGGSSNKSFDQLTPYTDGQYVGNTLFNAKGTPLKTGQVLDPV